MSIEMRKTGIDVVGDIPWGTHFCLFYENSTDILEILASYCKAGLENHEFCLWVVAEPLKPDDAKQALGRAVPDVDRYWDDESIEIISARDWYLQDGTFDLERVIAGWDEKLVKATAKGYAGVRVTGDTAWLEKKDWRDFCEYEDSLNDSIANQRLAVLCTYPLAACGASEILDVVRTHQFAIVRRHRAWEVIETAGHKQAKAEIKRLEERERLRQLQADLAYLSRLSTMGELTASLAHEMRQPISAALTNAKTCLRWLAHQQPDMDEARAAASRMIKDATRAANTINSISSLFHKGAVERQAVDLGELIQEMIVLLQSEAHRYAISIRTDLAQLPAVMADRVQLQQVFMNLMLNAIDAMKDLGSAGELIIRSQPGDEGQILISISDTGMGLAPEQAEQIFNAFYSTKPQGIGMGLPIGRSIIESHGGRLWYSANSGPGATFHFTLPTRVEARGEALSA